MLLERFVPAKMYYVYEKDLGLEVGIKIEQKRYGTYDPSDPSINLFANYFKSDTVFNLFDKDGDSTLIRLKDKDGSSYTQNGYTFADFDIDNAEYTKPNGESITLPKGIYVAIKMENNSKFYASNYTISGSGLINFGLSEFLDNDGPHYVFMLTKETTVTIKCTQYIEYVGEATYSPLYKIKVIG